MERRHTIWPILFFPHSSKSIDFIVSCAGSLQPHCIATALMKNRILSLLLCDLLLDFAEAVADGRHGDRQLLVVWRVNVRCWKF